MLRYHAAWVLPIASAPIRDGWVAVDGGRIVATGPPGAVGWRAPSATSDRVALLPGLVNAHTHLELSYLRDAVPPASEFVTWIRAVMAARRSRPDPGCAEILEALDRGIAEAVRCGTALVGDISNTLVTFAPLVRSPLSGVVFYELLKFNPPDAAALVDQALEQIHAPRGRVRRARQPGGARAVLGRARGLARHAPGDGPRPEPVAVQRAPVGVAGRSRVHRHRRRPVAGAARRGRAPGIRHGPRQA